MVRPGARNLITDVAGIRIGQAEDERVRTGVTVLLADEPALAVVDVRGGAPSTRDTEGLDLVSLVEAVDAIVLSGGSAFGNDAPRASCARRVAASKLRPARRACPSCAARSCSIW